MGWLYLSVVIDLFSRKVVGWAMANHICNSAIKGRCITHDLTNIFYADDDHPSLKGAELINELIIEKIKHYLDSQ